MRARAVAHDHDTGGIEPQPRGIIDQIARCVGDIGGLVFNGIIRHQPIVDRGIGIAKTGIVWGLVITRGIVLAAALPSAAVDKHNQWRALGAALRWPIIKVLQLIWTIGQGLLAGRLRDQFGGSAAVNPVAQSRPRIGQ